MLCLNCSDGCMPACGVFHQVPRVFYCAVLLSAVVTQCSALQGIGQIVSNCLVSSCLSGGR